MSFTLDDSKAVKPRIAGLFMMPLRWIAAWILFAAAWRRLVLKPEALNPHSPLYEGIKLNHFVPHAIWIKFFLNYVVTHPDILLIFLWCFTIVELVSGIFLFIGLGTRVIGLLLMFLFMNLMLAAGWLGTTCLDEWTVACFGIGIGMCLFLSGSGPYSIDAMIFKKFHHKAQHHLWSLFISPELSFIHDYKIGKRYALVLSALILAFALYTNQAIVGGVYGPFHNPAVAMHIKMHAQLNENGNLDLTLYRNQGPDTYGAFIVNIVVKDAAGKVVSDYNAQKLGHLSQNEIENFYIVKAKPNGASLLLPLSSLVTLHLKPTETGSFSPGKYSVSVTDVSGKTWETNAVLQNKNIKETFKPSELLKI